MDKFALETTATAGYGVTEVNKILLWMAVCANLQEITMPNA